MLHEEVVPRSGTCEVYETVSQEGQRSSRLSVTAAIRKMSNSSYFRSTA